MILLHKSDKAKTKDGVLVVRKDPHIKGRIFYDRKGNPYRCEGWNEKFQDCVFHNFRTDKKVVGCLEGFYDKNPKI